MIRILYISTAREAHVQNDLAPILRVSRRNNAALNVTGLLVAGGRRFLQVLEGPADAVEQTYGRICGDARHIAPVLLSKRSIDDRLFGEWAMGFQPAGVGGNGGAVNEEVAALVAPISDPTIKAYFEGFVRRHAA